jgi:hypothetical protein
VAAVKQGGVLGLRQVEQFGDGESHGGRLGETTFLAKEKASVPRQGRTRLILRQPFDYGGRIFF